MNREITKRIALYGGAFDPPHRGHLSIISNLRSLPFVDEIWVLPSGDRSDKRLLLSMTERFDLLRKLLDHASGMTQVKLCNQEIVLSKELNRMIPTIQLLQHFDKKYPTFQFHFVVGADIFSTIDTWQQYQKLLNEHKFIVYPRVGYELPDWEGKTDFKNKPIHFFLSPFIATNISSSFIKKTLLDSSLDKAEKRQRVKQFLDQITLQILESKSYL